MKPYQAGLQPFSTRTHVRLRKPYYWGTLEEGSQYGLAVRLAGLPLQQRHARSPGMPADVTSVGSEFCATVARTSCERRADVHSVASREENASTLTEPGRAGSSTRQLGFASTQPLVAKESLDAA
jgi:hypothetical protein